jgi:hypothetical protein
MVALAPRQTRNAKAENGKNIATRLKEEKNSARIVPNRPSSEVMIAAHR